MRVHTRDHVGGTARMIRHRDHLVVFARAPELGRVKTRLAAEVGPLRALEIYRQLGERVTHALRDGPAHVVIAHEPPRAAPAMRAWLGEGVDYEPQSDGDLGTRMAQAMTARILAGAERIVVIGTDCPSVTAETITGAFAELDEADVVFGPALDGGYYLIGAREAHTCLFHDIPWSTAHTLDVSLARARAAGLHVALLPPMRDIDTAADWRAYEETSAGA